MHIVRTSMKDSSEEANKITANVLKKNNGRHPKIQQVQTTNVERMANEQKTK